MRACVCVCVCVSGGGGGGISDAEFDSTANVFIAALLVEILWIKVEKSSIPGLSQCGS